MRTTLGCAVAALLCLGGSLFAEDKEPEKIDPKKLVGKWTLKDREGATLRMEFTKDRMLTLTFVDADGKENKFERTYSVEGDRLLIWLKGDFEGESWAIIKLTDTELVTKDARWESKYTFIRPKDK
jgi:uncharacterized protein (TIGR03066 family)